MNGARITEFIQQFRGCEEVFLFGMCYWFAHILTSRFGGEILYHAVDNHFIARINERLWDARGDVTSIYSREDLVLWDEYEKTDKAHYERIVKYCIQKER